MSYSEPLSVLFSRFFRYGKFVLFECVDIWIGLRCRLGLFKIVDQFAFHGCVFEEWICILGSHDFLVENCGSILKLLDRVVALIEFCEHLGVANAEISIPYTALEDWLAYRYLVL